MPEVPLVLQTIKRLFQKGDEVKAVYRNLVLRSHVFMQRWEIEDNLGRTNPRNFVALSANKRSMISEVM